MQLFPVLLDNYCSTPEHISKRLKENLRRGVLFLTTEMNLYVSFEQLMCVHVAHLKITTHNLKWSCSKIRHTHVVCYNSRILHPSKKL